jgi:hypothetical protein
VSARRATTSKTVPVLAVPGGNWYGTVEGLLSAESQKPPASAAPDAARRTEARG